MEKFLETFNLQRLNYDEIGNVNRPITRNKVESIIKNLTTNQNPWPDGFTGEFHQISKEELIVIS